MTQTILTPSVIAQEALMILENNLVWANLVYRDYQSEFTGKKVFYLNGVPDPIANWAGFFAGHYKELQEPQWECADRQHLHETPQADILVVGLPQYVWYDDSRNPIINIVAATMILRCWRNKPILKEGGVVILVSKCDGHIDADKHPSNARALELFGSVGSAQALEEKLFESLYTDKELLERYHHHNAYHPVHPIWLFNENQYALDHAGRIIIATGENPGAPALVGAEHAATFDEAMERAIDTMGADARVLVLPNYFSAAPMVFQVE